MLLTKYNKSRHTRFYCNLPAKTQKKTSHLSKSTETNKKSIKSAYLSNFRAPIEPYEIDLKISHTILPVENNNHLLILNLENNQDIVKPSTFICVLDVSGSMSGSSSYRGDSEASKFSRLDLVQHSVNTIIHCLRPEDSLALLIFTNETKVLLDVTKMDEKGKNLAKKSLYSIHADGGTNLWSGLDAAVNKLTALNSNMNQFVIMLTDGEPNDNPSRGILHEFKNKIDGSVAGNVHTIGYGYDLNSDLLLQIA